MKRPNNIFLIGPMGTGKTTIGRHLASALGMEFEDSDAEIQRRTGVDIPLIFELEGEVGFRKRERKVIEQLTAREDLVLATGGGAVLDPDNRRHLTGRGLVIYLHCSPEQQYQRTARDRNRPLLHDGDPRVRLQELMEQRDSLYRQTSDFTVSTERRNATAVVKEITRKLGLASR